MTPVLDEAALVLRPVPLLAPPAPRVLLAAPKELRTVSLQDENGHPCWTFRYADGSFDVTRDPHTAELISRYLFPRY